jgi:hypothetical protein
MLAKKSLRKICCWLSNLHLFSRRSLGKQQFDVILAAARSLQVHLTSRQSQSQEKKRN